jgi:hypothetical protein
VAQQRYAPFLSMVSQVRCRLLAGSGADAAIADLGAHVVSEGANLVVIETRAYRNQGLSQFHDPLTWRRTDSPPVNIHLADKQGLFRLRGKGDANLT